MSNRIGDWSQTYTGGKFYPLDVREEDINIEDIAHSLSMTCRYGGHCEYFYSVAEHSYLCSHAVEPEFALEALLHDASEAYLSDIIRPLKRQLQDYRQYEAAAEKVINAKYGLPAVMSPEVKEVDDRILVDEYNAMMTKTVRWRFHDLGTQPIGVEIQFWHPRVAKLKFLERFNELTQR